MSKINEKKNAPVLNREEKEFAELLHEALRDEGLGIPTTIEEVKNAEENDLETKFSDLPTWLQDPAEVLRHKPEFTLRLISQRSVRDETLLAAGVARAARLGGAIPKEVEEKMRNDRKSAEEKAKETERR